MTRRKPAQEPAEPEDGNRAEWIDTPTPGDDPAAWPEADLEADTEAGELVNLPPNWGSDRARPDEAGALVLDAEWLAKRDARILEEQARLREFRDLGMPVNVPEVALPAEQKEALRAEGHGDYADSVADEITPDEARARLEALSPGMTEAMFRQVWPAYYRATTAFGAAGIAGMAALEDPGPITYVATGDGRPYLAVFRDPWEVLELTEDGPYGAVMTSVIHAAGALVGLFMESTRAGLTESLSAELAEAFEVAAKARATLLEELRRLYRPNMAPIVAPTRGAVSRRLAARTQALGEILHFSADRAHAGVVAGLGQMSDWAALQGWDLGMLVSDSASYRQIVGFPTAPAAELWEFLKGHGEGAIKAHYALSARCYEATGGDPGQYVTVSIPQFCEDLGYTRQKAGGFKTRDKQKAMKILEAMTTAELAASYKTAKGWGRLAGRIWERGIKAEHLDEYGDLLGHARAGDRELWDPVGFTYRPGPFAADPAWRKLNNAVGKIGIGLLKLDTRDDKWAIRIGGYYGTLARNEQYRDRLIKVATVLARTGLGKQDAKHPAAQRERFEAAHDRLCEVGLLKAWEFASAAVEGEPDMDDPEELSGLADYDAGDWRQTRVRLTWPDSLTDHTPRLEAGRKRAKRAKGRQAQTLPSERHNPTLGAR